MEIKVDELLDKLSGHVKSIANTESVLGDEFTIGDFTCRPVIKFGTGFGSGTGTGDSPKAKGKGSSVGAGAGMGVVPVGFLTAKGGEISFIPVDKKSALSTLFEQVPDLVEKMAEMKAKKEGEEEEEAK
jgi:uncharacterized spore protein YtfJ